MSYTAEQRDQLKAAIAKGATRLKMGQEEVQFRSLAEMRGILADIEAELASNAPGRTQHYPQFMERPL
jgi:hypothetical protein